MIIAIDGPAGSGKTTTARKVAECLGIIHINTGAMYRGIALKIIRANIDLGNMQAIKQLLDETVLNFRGANESELYMDGTNISEEISSSVVTENVSCISAIPEIRNKLVEYQQRMANGNNVVLEGRDIGTIVFPDADYKFYLVADIHVRAERRKKEMEMAGDYISIEDIIADLNARDQKDITRLHSPLLKAEDAIELDTTNLSIDEQVNYIIDTIN